MARVLANFLTADITCNSYLSGFIDVTSVINQLWFISIIWKAYEWCIPKLSCMSTHLTTKTTRDKHQYKWQSSCNYRNEYRKFYRNKPLSAPNWLLLLLIIFAVILNIWVNDVCDGFETDSRPLCNIVVDICFQHIGSYFDW